MKTTHTKISHHTTPHYTTPHHTTLHHTTPHHTTPHHINHCHAPHTHSLITNINTYNHSSIGSIITNGVRKSLLHRWSDATSQQKSDERQKSEVLLCHDDPNVCVGVVVITKEIKTLARKVRPPFLIEVSSERVTADRVKGKILEGCSVGRLTSSSHTPSSASTPPIQPTRTPGRNMKSTVVILIIFCTEALDKEG